MPDRSDIEQALAGLVAATLYPDGFDAVSAVSNPCKIYRGWPVAQALEKDLERGLVHVSVVSASGPLRDRTRYASDWQGTQPVPTLQASVSGEVVTFDGTGGAGQVAGIRVDGQAYAYRMRSGDSASLVAAALAALIRVDRPAVATGTSVYLLGGRGADARVVTDGVGGEELRRQEGRFRITFWCPDPATRDAVVALADTRLAGSNFIDVDGWACRLQLVADDSNDDRSAASLWRRDLVYLVEFPTVQAVTLPAMLFGVAAVNGVDWIG